MGDSPLGRYRRVGSAGILMLSGDRRGSTPVKAVSRCWTRWSPRQNELSSSESMSVTVQFRRRRCNRASWASKRTEGVAISDHQVSLFEPSQRAEGYRAELLDFMAKHVYPAELVYEAQMRESGNPHHHPH